MTEDKTGRDQKGRFAQGHALSLQHGGAGAVKRIRDGEEFIGLARETEIAVQEELAQSGRLALLTRNACRLQTATDLYYGALLGAAEAGDLEQFTRHLKTWGWLAGSAIRAWAEVRHEELLRPKTLDYDALVRELINSGKS
jgi:hypothetical protein